MLPFCEKKLCWIVQNSCYLERSLESCLCSVDELGTEQGCILKTDETERKATSKKEAGKMSQMAFSQMAPEWG